MAEIRNEFRLMKQTVQPKHKTNYDMTISFTRFATLLTLICGFHGLFAQINLSGVINRYTTITSIDYCDGNISVTNIDGFSIGDAALVIQVQGATIYEERDSDFGRVTNIGNAGKYEKVAIADIQGNTIILENPVMNTYDLEEGTQLVSFPRFTNANISNLVEAQAWDGETGGVVALEVTGTLTLDAVISASGAGFRGGIGEASDNGCNSFTNASQVYYQVGDWRGASKGEGVAKFIPNKENGRGPQANGGGGGNDHNTGGAGGSNVTIGGDGGQRDIPLLSLLCKGLSPGIKGYALADEEDRIFFGGGGGAGHTNNRSDVNGASGGGIVIVQAARIIANGQTISASGADAEDIVGDGAAGGGAGGTIILLTDEIVGDLSIDISGGNGGSASSDGDPNCFGPGGGGSGGRLLTNSISPNVITAGGLAGLSLNNGAADCNNTTNGAEDGQSGRQLPINTIAENTAPATAAEILFQPSDITACTTQDAVIEVAVEGAGLSYQWQLDSGAGFQDLFDNSVYEGTQSPRLIISNLTANLDGFEYRLQIRSDCFDDLTTDAIPLSIMEGMLPDVSFEYQLLPGGAVVFTNTSTGGESFLWSFNGGVSSNMMNASFVYPAEGDYPVTLTVTNECGFVSVTETINVIFEPTAAFSANVPDGCAPYIVDFMNESSDNATDFRWSFPGGTPATSTEPNPSITYNDGGVYDVELIATNIVGADTIYLEEYITIASVPEIQFSVTASGLTVFLDNVTVGATSYEWDFGDGNTSIEANPTHTYDDLGAYTITLFASNECGETFAEEEIAVGATPLALFSSSSVSGCPDLVVQFLDQSQGVVNAWSWSFPGGQPSESTDPNPIVTYSEVGTYRVELMVSNELDQDDVVIESYIEVGAPPVANFDFSVDGRTVSFLNLSDAADRYAWSFGDGTISTEANPTHTFQSNDLYFVTLNAYNDFCGTSTTIPVSILVSGTTNIDEDTQVVIAPNPAQNFVHIDIKTPSAQAVEVRLLDLQGKLLLHTQMNSKQLQQLDVSKYASGVYFIQLLSDTWQMTERIIVQK